MNEQTTDRPTDRRLLCRIRGKRSTIRLRPRNSCFLGDSLLHRYSIGMISGSSRKNMHIWVSIIISHRKSRNPGIAGYRYGRRSTCRHRHVDIGRHSDVEQVQVQVYVENESIRIEMTL